MSMSANEHRARDLYACFAAAQGLTALWSTLSSDEQLGWKIAARRSQQYEADQIANGDEQNEPPSSFVWGGLDGTACDATWTTITTEETE